ncbi:MAG TPA: hypothetical protein VEC36_03235 [Patescibacteria group bacterium]|nr:hypothetical protein [Patescibacteria group bacterium]
MKKGLLIFFLLIGISQSLIAQDGSLEDGIPQAVVSANPDILIIDWKYDIPFPEGKLLKKIKLKRDLFQTKALVLQQCIDAVRSHGGNCFKITYYDNISLNTYAQEYGDRIRGEIYTLKENELHEIRSRMENYTGVEKISEKKITKEKIEVKIPEKEFSFNGQGDNKGWILFHWSFPYINHLHMAPLGEPSKNGTGFIGISYGVDYFYHKNQYINLSYSGVMDYNTPLIFVPRGDEHEVLRSTYLSLSNNHKINNLSLGYGPVFARNSWELANLFWEDKNQQNISPGRKPEEKYNYTLGLIFSAYLHTSGAPCIGLIYKPTFLRLNAAHKFSYEHSISIDFAIKGPVTRLRMATDTQ